MNPMMGQMLQQLLQRNPALMQSQNAANIIRILQSGDAQAGEQLARNYCQSLGMTPEQAYMQVKQQFHLQ